MAIRDADLWHQVHAEREDGVAATFLIRDVEPRPDQPQIFVVELPYPVTDDSKLPDPASYRRLDTFQEQWVEPACEALGWTLVAWKSEDGAFYLYLYGDGDPNALLERLAPFDSELGFFHDRDADWSEYAALRDLVDQSEAASDDDEGDGDAEGGHVHTDACDHDHDHTHDHTHDHDHDHTSNGVLVIDHTGEPSTARATDARIANGHTGSAKATRAKTTPPRTASKASRSKQATARTTTKRPPTNKPARSGPIPKPAKRPAKQPAAATSSMTKPSAKKPSASRSSTRSAARKGGPRRPATKRR